MVSANGYDGIKEYIRKTVLVVEVCAIEEFQSLKLFCCLEKSFERILVYKRESIFVRDLEEVW